MTKYHTINLDKEYYNHLQKFIEQHPEYTSVKEFLKESANQKKKQIENQETEQLLQVLDKILKNSNLTQKEVQKMIKENQENMP